MLGIGRCDGRALGDANHHEKISLWGGGRRGPAKSTTPSSGEGRRCLGQQPTDQFCDISTHTQHARLRRKAVQGIVVVRIAQRYKRALGSKICCWCWGNIFSTKQPSSQRREVADAQCAAAEHRREAGPESVAPCLGTRTMTTRSRYSLPREDCTK